ncbi:hypothetical protein V6N13_064996 [Hibiscus sabdariffa]
MIVEELEVSKKHIIIQGHVESEPLWKLSRCLVGTMATDVSVESVKDRLHRWGLDNIEVKWLGVAEVPSLRIKYDDQRQDQNRKSENMGTESLGSSSTATEHGREHMSQSKSDPKCSLIDDFSEKTLEKDEKLKENLVEIEKIMEEDERNFSEGGK